MNRLVSNTYAIEADNLVRSLPLENMQIEVLKGVSFKINSGEWVALTGPSGSGKTTLLGILSGLDTPNSGTIILDGIDVTHLPETEMAKVRNRKIGIVFQSYNLIPNLTAQENVEVPLYVSSDRKRIRERAFQMLELVGLANRRNHRPYQLSGGEQQRVAIARALVTQPALIFADEPTGNLDSQIGGQVLELFVRLRRQFGFTVVMATHDKQVAALAERHLHLVDGRLVDVMNGDQQ